MKFTPAILIVALAVALLAAVIAAEEITASGGGGTGSGCPDSTACTKSCKKQGYSVGICLEPLLTVCACFKEISTRPGHPRSRAPNHG
ncbi:hypothetical protein MRX96_035784 [Rhipicephalus microplus]